MERGKKFSIDKLPGRDLTALEGFVPPGVIERAFNDPKLAPEKGTGKYSLRNALERKKFWDNADQTFLYNDKAALQHRRNTNRNLHRPKGGR